MEHHADVKKEDTDEKTALFYAACGNHIEVVSVLKKAGATVKAEWKSEFTSLLGAISTGDMNMLSAMMETANVNQTCENGKTPLMFASLIGNINMVQKIISEGGKVTAKDRNQETSLMIAAQKGHKGVAEALIAKRCEVNAKNKHGKTALMFAAENGHNEVVKILITKGAEVNTVTNEGKTTLMFAAENGHKEVVKILIATGAKGNPVTNEGETALTLAAQEKVLVRLVQSSEKLFTKTRFIKEDVVRALLNEDKQLWDYDFQEIIERAYDGESFSANEKEEMKKKLQKVSVYDEIRIELLKAGGYDVQNVKNKATKYVPKNVDIGISKLDD